MAVGILGVLSATGTTLILSAGANSRTAEYSKDNASAYSLAEAGLNEMMAVLSNPKNNALNSTLLPATTGTYADGTVTWSGTLDKPNALWSLSSTAKVENPTGPSTSDVTRTLNAKVRITPQNTQPIQNQAWNWVFLTDTANACDLTLPANFEFNSPLYMWGDLCLSPGSRIIGGPIAVKERVTMNNNDNYIGTASAPISEVHVSVGCKYASQHAHPAGDGHAFCSPVDKVFANVLDQQPPDIPIPPLQLDVWYANAVPGPHHPCTYVEGVPPVFDTDTTRNSSVATTFNLTPPAVSYVCRVGPASEPVALMSWTHTTRTLRLDGTIFIDGSAQAANSTGPINFDGHGTIYLSGTFLVNGGATSAATKLCGVALASDCDFAAWNPNNEMLTVVAPGGSPGVSIGANARYQGALYSVGPVNLNADARSEGPIVAPTLELGSRAVIDTFPQILDTVPTGTPGTEPVFPYPNPPESFSG